MNEKKWNCYEIKIKCNNDNNDIINNNNNTNKDDGNTGIPLYTISEQLTEPQFPPSQSYT